MKDRRAFLPRLLRRIADEAKQTPRRLRSLAPRPVWPTLRAVRDLEAAGADTWRITGARPQLALEGALTGGMVELRLTGSATSAAAVGLAHGAPPDGTRLNLLGHLGPQQRELVAMGYLRPEEAPSLCFSCAPQAVTISGLQVRLVSPVEMIRKAAELIRAGDKRLPRSASAARDVWDTARHQMISGTGMVDAYARWRAFNDLDPAELEILRTHARALPYRPRISVIVPVYNPDPRVLERCVASVRAQLYTDWELCLADDASPQEWVRAKLQEYAAADPRIRVTFRSKNGHISAASNSALELATGEFVALMDHDDELTPDALFYVALALNRDPELDLIYSDEDKLDECGERVSPRFKPGWSPELLLSQMYIGHLGVYRRSIVAGLGGFREGFEGSQDHDLALRFTEQTDRIHHIPRILYHWRMSAASAAGGHDAKPYTIDAGRRAIEDRLRRQQRAGWVESPPEFPGHHIVHYAPAPQERVSILIPTRDGAALLDRCIESIHRVTRHPNWDLCIVDNGSRERETFEVLSRWQRHLGERLKVLPQDVPFNFSQLINAGAAATRGDLLLLLNNDTEVLQENWLDELAGYARQHEIGAVGCRLLYPDGDLQHGGVVLDAQAVAMHAEQGIHGMEGGYYGHLVSSTNFSAVTGACLMTRRTVFEKLGGLDEALRVAYNDVDYCLRARAEGLRTVLLGHVRLVHHESKSRGYETTRAKRARLSEEAQFMRLRWGTTLAEDFARNPNLGGDRPNLVALRTPGFWLPGMTASAPDIVAPIRHREGSRG